MSRGEKVKHTPGPWEVFKRKVSGEIVQLDIEHRGQRVASINIRPDISFEANSHLIAVAPEMLGALNAFVGLEFYEAGTPRIVAYQTAMKNASDAIRKAKGEL